MTFSPTWEVDVNTIPHEELYNNPDDVVGESYNAGSRGVCADATGVYVIGWKSIAGTPNALYQVFIEKRSLVDGSIIWQKFLDSWQSYE